MARWNRNLGFILCVCVGLMLAVHPVWAGSKARRVHQVAQNVPGMESMDSSGTLGSEDEEGLYEDSEEGKKRLERSKAVKAKKLTSTSGGLGDDADALVPYSKYFTAGYVGDEMDPVGGVIGNRSTRTFGDMVSRDALTFPDYLYIDIGQEDDVEVGDRFIVYSQYREVRHPLQTFFITFEREVDAIDGPYKEDFYWDPWSVEHDTVGNQILVKGVIRVVETASITSKAIVEKAFNQISVDDLIIPHPERQPPMVSINYVPPKKNNEGYIISNRGNNLIFTMNDVVYLDIGEEDGVDVGDRFEIYAYPLTIDEDPEDINPDIIGEVTVISVQEETATGIVLNASEPLIPGQKIRSKR